MEDPKIKPAGSETTTPTQSLDESQAPAETQPTTPTGGVKEQTGTTFRTATSKASQLPTTPAGTVNGGNPATRAPLTDEAFRKLVKGQIGSIIQSYMDKTGYSRTNNRLECAIFYKDGRWQVEYNPEKTTIPQDLQDRIALKLRQFAMLKANPNQPPIHFVNVF